MVTAFKTKMKIVMMTVNLTPSIVLARKVSVVLLAHKARKVLKVSKASRVAVARKGFAANAVLVAHLA